MIKLCERYRTQNLKLHLTPDKLAAYGRASVCVTEGGEECGGQEGLEGSGQEECGGDEEGEEGYLCPEVSEPCLGGYLRWQQDASHRGDEEDLDLHQEVQVE